MVKRILLALGGSSLSNVAVKRAVDLAKAQQATLTAIVILDLDSWKSRIGSTMSGNEASRIAESRPWEAAQMRLERAIAGFRQACEQAGIAHEVLHSVGREFEQLISQWRYHDLLVFGLRGLFESSLVPEPERAIAEMIQSGVRPILAVSREVRPIRRVLIAYSGSVESAKAMKQFAQMKLWPDTQVRVACFNKAADEAETLLANACKYLQAHSITASAEAVSGSAISRLLPYAHSMNADLIVLGNSYRSILTSSLLGDIMLHVTRHSDIPLFLSH